MNGSSFPQQLLTWNTASPASISLRQTPSGSWWPHFRAWTRRCSRLWGRGSGRGCQAGPPSRPGQPEEGSVVPGAREQDSRDVVCGICMDKVWDKPEAERIFGILPNCSHAHCLGCLRTWRKSQRTFPLDVIKACPQCRVHSSYIIPHKFWVSKGAAKEQLIRNFKARTCQIRCRFFMQGNGRCPFKSDCIYLHQQPDKALTSDPPWTESAGPSRVPRGHRAGRRSVLHGLCLGHGLLGFGTLAGSR
ncbi:probable E3 ubiquitin-protein ligase makorin-1 isoform X2 [Mirounga angustirostris]|uniref:probable E3 ubiquitin-protein ligase makorin-1 isoform X2 n=2 Tax=Mirounga TaxID=9714 RepID=UPI00313F11D4